MRSSQQVVIEGGTSLKTLDNYVTLLLPCFTDGCLDRFESYNRVRQEGANLKNINYVFIHRVLIYPVYFLFKLIIFIPDI